MSVCSATAAASSRPGRRESRSSSKRASTNEQHFYICKGGHKPLNQRKYSTMSTTRPSSSIMVDWCELGYDFIG